MGSRCAVGLVASSRMSRSTARLRSASSEKRPHRDWSGGIGFVFTQLPQAYWKKSEHGSAVLSVAPTSNRSEQVSENVLQVTQGALYPALHRLEQQGWLKAEWRPTGTGREAKFYSLTRAGRAQLERELEQWERLSGAVALVIRTA